MYKIKFYSIYYNFKLKKSTMKKLFLGALLSLNLIAYAQKTNKEILFTIDNNSYYTDEFARVYKKNLDLVKDESQKDLNQYLELFVGYKLKVNKANKLGLQNGEAYKSELQTYRTQLSKNYLSDSKVTTALVEEGYNRSLKEVKASHILITVEENAAAEDTLKAYNQIKDIYERAIKGEDFANLATQFSQDPSAKENKGNLGYFSAFRMIYPFETAAFTTPIGKISKPVRTRFGYHIIKVEDVRDNRGEVTVAHIMIMNPEKAEEAATAKTKIDDIYKKLNQGEKFDDLAKQFSEDKSSSGKGGVLNRFGSGQLSSEEFEGVAFELKNKDEISEPFQSKYGWHIMKLIEKHPVKTLSEMKSELETKIGKDERSRKLTTSLNDKLRKKYTIKRDDKLYAKLVTLVTDAVYESKWEMPTDTKSFDGKLFDVNNKLVSGTDFLNFVKTQQKSATKIKPVSKWVDNVYQKFIDDQLNTYYNANLEGEFPEFANVMEEYRDGLLLFDLMEKEIWEKSKTDSIGLKKFYDANKSNYNWKNRYDVVIASSTKLDIIKKAEKLFKKQLGADKIKEQLNTKDKVELMTNSGTFEEGNETLPKNLKPQVGLSEITKEGDYYFITKVNKILPAGSKTLEECKGKAINDYQQYLEQNWVDSLKKEFTVKINQDVFENVKKQIKNN
jgi:peptidyl-prolyl cis-trans isomerase SurA